MRKSHIHQHFSFQIVLLNLNGHPNHDSNGLKFHARSSALAVRSELRFKETQIFSQPEQLRLVITGTQSGQLSALI
jgi:hypothetical protein